MKEILLPHYFKKFAITTGLLSTILWALSSSNQGLINVKPFILAWVFKIMILLSLIIYVLSKEKVENEKIAQLRVSNIIAALFGGIMFLILDTFLEIIYAGEQFEMMSAYHLIMLVLCIYTLSFYIKKNIKTVARAQ